MNIRICNAQHRLTGYKEGLFRFFRIANAYTLHCRIANSAGRVRVVAEQAEACAERRLPLFRHW
jgi:hypothetical protein